jgi:perosamine synthetase
VSAVELERLELPDDQRSSGRDLGHVELELVRQVIESGTLTATKGVQVPALEREFAAQVGAGHVVACASGSAAVHAAVAAVDPEPGEEIVTTPITDMGALSPILYQGAIPAFADVDPRTGNVTAATVQAALSERTRAIVVTHLFGVPADLRGIGELAASRGIPIIEDAAQAFGATSGGRPVGTVGAIGCFSMQQGKHVTTGEGGLVLTDDAGTARRLRVFVNKAWPYGEADPDHEFLALNYRLTELQGAVARAQLSKLDRFVRARRDAAAAFADAIDGVAGVRLVAALPGDEPSWWRLPLLVDAAYVPGGPVALAAALRELQIPSGPRYIQKPAFACRVFRDQRTFGSSRWPFTLARPGAVDYDPDRFGGAAAFLRDVLVLPFNERFTPELASRLGDAVGHAASRSVAA